MHQSFINKLQQKEKHDLICCCDKCKINKYETNWILPWIKACYCLLQLQEEEEQEEYRHDFFMPWVVQVIVPGVITVIQANYEYNNCLLIQSSTELLFWKKMFLILMDMPFPLEQKSFRDTAMSLLRLLSKAMCITYGPKLVSAIFYFFSKC